MGDAEGDAVGEHGDAHAVGRREPHLGGDAGHVAVVADEGAIPPPPHLEAEAVALLQVGVVGDLHGGGRGDEPLGEDAVALQHAAAQHHAAEVGQLPGGGGEAAHRGGDQLHGGGRLGADAGRHDGPVRGGGARALAPGGEGGADHAERLQHVLAGGVLERRAEGQTGQEPGHVQTGVGVDDALARAPLDPQAGDGVGQRRGRGAVGDAGQHRVAEVGAPNAGRQARRVRQEAAQRGIGRLAVGVDDALRLGQPLVHRLVQVQQAVAHRLQHGGGGQLLGHGRHPEHGVRRDQLAPVQVGEPDAAAEAQPVDVEPHDGQAVHPSLPQPPLDLLDQSWRDRLHPADPTGRRPGGCRGRGRRRGRRHLRRRAPARHRPR